MIALEIALNGKRLCVAGVPVGTVTAIVGTKRHRGRSVASGANAPKHDGVGASYCERLHGDAYCTRVPVVGVTDLPTAPSRRRYCCRSCR